MKGQNRVYRKFCSEEHTSAARGALRAAKNHEDGIKKRIERNAKDAISEVDEYIAKHGVKKCPTMYCAPVMGAVPPDVEWLKLRKLKLKEPVGSKKGMADFLKSVF